MFRLPEKKKNTLKKAFLKERFFFFRNIERWVQ